MASFMIGSAIGESWKLFKLRPWFYVGFIGVYFLVYVALGMVAEIEYVGWAITFVGELLLTMGSLQVAITGARGGVPKLKQLFTTYERILPFLGGMIVTAIITLLGFVLLIIPGIIASLGLQFFAYFILDKGYSVRESLRASWDATKGSKWQLLGLGIVLVLINFVGILLFGVGLFVTIPLSMLTMAHVYLVLSGSRSEVTELNEPGQSSIPAVGSQA